MAQVTLTINGWPYTVGCDDGQEERVKRLGLDLDRQVSGLARSAPGASEALLLVFAGLTLAEEQADIKDRVAALEKQIVENRMALEQASQRLLQQRDEISQYRMGDEALAHAIAQLAERIEIIAVEMASD